LQAAKRFSSDNSITSIISPTNKKYYLYSRILCIVWVLLFFLFIEFRHSWVADLKGWLAEVAEEVLDGTQQPQG